MSQASPHAEGPSQGPSQSQKGSLRQALGVDRHPLTAVKWAWIAIAGVMILLGAFLAASSPSDANSGAPDGESGKGLPFSGTSFTQSSGSGEEGGSGETENADDNGVGLKDLSPTFLKGGFGMFVGFAIGFAIRAFLRLAVLIVGVYMLALTLMAYAGWVEIHWDVMGDQFDQLVENLDAQFKSFKAFLTGSIPTSGMAALGFFVGLKKK